MDYLPAIQFAAALNIGYLLPDIMSKMNSVLNNINNGYVDILQAVQNKIIVKSQEVSGKCVVETKDNRTTKGYIDQQLNNLKSIKEGCDAKESSLSNMIDGYVNCSGYRSVFFYSGMFSVLALILIPFCHQYNDLWGIKMFFYTLNSISIVYISILFVVVLLTRNDISCRGVFGMFMMFILIAAVAAYVNSLLPVLVKIGPVEEKLMASLSVIVSFIPIVLCMLFLMALVFYATLVARMYAFRAWLKFHRIDRAMKKLSVIDELLGAEVTVA